MTVLQGNTTASQWYRYLHHPGTAYTLRPHDIVLHQEDPRAHCTSVWSDGHSEDFILVPNSNQVTVGWAAHSSEDMPPQTITDLLPNQPCWIKLQATKCPTHCFQTFSNLSHVLSVNLLSSVKRTRYSGRPNHCGLHLRMLVELCGAGCEHRSHDDVRRSCHPLEVCF